MKNETKPILEIVESNKLPEESELNYNANIIADLTKIKYTDKYDWDKMVDFAKKTDIDFYGGHIKRLVILWEKYGYDEVNNVIIAIEEYFNSKEEEDE